MVHVTLAGREAVSEFYLLEKHIPQPVVTTIVLLLGFTCAHAACTQVTAILPFCQEARSESLSVWISVSVIHDWFFSTMTNF